MMKYYQAFSHERQEKIAEFVKTLTRLAEIEPAIAYEADQLNATYRALKEQQAELRQSQTQRQRTLIKLQTELSDKETRLSALIADRKRLETLLAKVYEEINSQELNFALGEFSKLKGRLPWPTKGRKLNAFGRKRSGSTIPWHGLEIAAKEGNDIIAIHHGQVVFSDYLRGHGLLLIIDHGSGFMSLYAHAKHLYKELGEWVEAGERVASVGTTGGRKEAALYFELRHNGKPTDPNPWFTRA
jgi:septal ring factor EnvC (AmiA/AmiB activator)